MTNVQITEKIQNMLPDDYSDSKDWKNSDIIGRIAWLKAMLENKTKEVELWVDMINQTEARAAGYRAYQEGISLNDNPFNNNEDWDFHLAWDEGWNNAAWDD